MATVANRHLRQHFLFPPEGYIFASSDTYYMRVSSYYNTAYNPGSGALRSGCVTGDYGLDLEWARPPSTASAIRCPAPWRRV